MPTTGLEPSLISISDSHLNPLDNKVQFIDGNPPCFKKEEDPKGWSTILITALGSWEKPVPRGQFRDVF
jgi:hypothetical protein